MKWLYWAQGKWQDQNPLLLGPYDHSFWMGSSVFDGARAFARAAPDLQLHCQRCCVSATKMMLQPKITGEEIAKLAVEGIRQFKPHAELYIRPMFYGKGGNFFMTDPEQTEFLLAIHELPLPSEEGFSAYLSDYQRPTQAMAPTDAKAGCLYPNTQRALRDAAQLGYTNAVVFDVAGHVAEFASSNLFLVKEGICYTPAINGSFLNGLTRQRVIMLLRAYGTTVIECALTKQDLLHADEVFSTGNYGKVLPCTRIGNTDYPVGPIYRQARRRYFEFAAKAVI